jgi:hypothetical protein
MKRNTNANEAWQSLLDELRTNAGGGADLVQSGALRFDGDRVVHLDTGPVSAYLKLSDYADYSYVERCVDLTSLVLTNTRFEHLDLAACTKLRSVELVSAYRAGCVNLAECPELDRFTANRMSADTETITLCVHPTQIGRAVPRDIEDRCRTAEGYLGVRLAVAPPGVPGLESDPLPTRWLVRHDEAELADVLAGYWGLQPDYFTRYRTPEDCPEFQRDTYRLVLEIEGRVAAGAFRRGGRSYDVREADRFFQHREFSDVRPVPEFMYATA